MKLKRGFYRALGVAWVVLAVAVAIISIIYLIFFNLTKNPLNNLFLSMPIFSEIALGILRDASPILMEFLGIFFAGFVIYLGLAISNLKGWARTVGIVFHIAMGIVIAMLAFTLYDRTSKSLVLQQMGVVDIVPVIVLVLGLVIGILLILIGVEMGSRSALEAFAGVVPQPVGYPTVNCPTCGEPMDVQNGRCLKCDADDTAIGQPSSARLIDLQNNEEYMVSVRKPTRIGREGGTDNEDFEILLPYGIVSSDHAMIEFSSGTFFLHARKDTNYTYVNDALTRDAPIKNGDVISFGNMKFRFEVIQ